MQLRGLELCSKILNIRKRETYQSNLLQFERMVLLPRYISKVLSMNVTARPRSSSIADQCDKSHNNNIVATAWQRVIDLTTQIHSIKRPDWWKSSSPPVLVTPWSGYQRSRHDDVADLSRATYHVYGRKFDIKAQRKHDGNVLVEKEKSRDSTQVKFISIYAFYSRLKARPAKLHFYQLLPPK